MKFTALSWILLTVGFAVHGLEQQPVHNLAEIENDDVFASDANQLVQSSVALKMAQVSVTRKSFITQPGLALGNKGHTAFLIRIAYSDYKLTHSENNGNPLLFDRGNTYISWQF